MVTNTVIFLTDTFTCDRVFFFFVNGVIDNVIFHFESHILFIILLFGNKIILHLSNIIA